MRALPFVGTLAVLAVSVAAHADDAAPGEAPPADAPPPKPKDRDVGLSIMGGVGAGFTLTAGQMSKEAVGPAGTVDVELGMRFLKHLYGTVLFQPTFFTPASSPKNTAAYTVGTRVGWLTNPEGFGLFGDLGIAYRIVSVSDTNGNPINASGAAALVGLGLHFKFGPFRLFMPRLDFTPGMTGDYAHFPFTLGLVAMVNYDIGRRAKHED